MQDLILQHNWASIQWITGESLMLELADDLPVWAHNYSSLKNTSLLDTYYSKFN